MKAVASRTDRDKVRTLFWGTTFGLSSSLVTGLVWAWGQTTIQLVDLVRRSIETLAIGFAYHTARSGRHQGPETRGREAMASRVVSMALLAAAGLLAVVAVLRYLGGQGPGNVWWGVAQSTGDLVLNSVFWAKYRRLARGAVSPILESQRRLYGTKVASNLTMVAALVVIGVTDGRASVVIDLVASGVLIGLNVVVALRNGRTAHGSPVA